MDCRAQRLCGMELRLSRWEKLSEIMPARIRKIRHDDETRLKIKSAQIINRLQGHVMGDVDLSQTQVSAGLGLLRKTIPDLSQAALTDKDGGPLQISVVKFTDGPSDT